MARRSKADELIDFEILFYGRLLAAYPDFVDALVPLGEAYTRKRLYHKGLEVDLRLTRLRGHDPLTWYNLACSYSLLGRVDESLDAFRRACQLGYSDLEFASKDPDLTNLRHFPRFREFIESLTSRQPS